MISLFQIAPNDQSVNYLGQIFGVMQAGVLAPQKASMLLGALFRVFNTSVLTLGACIVIYTTIVGLLKTAQEGEFLGKQWSSLWVPLRTTVGIAALFPFSTGYSAIQVFFMWIILQGVGAADTLWNTALDYTAFAGSPISVQEAGDKFDSDDGTLDLYLAGLFQGLVCQAEFKKNGPDYFFPSENKTVSYFCNKNPNDVFCTQAALNTSLCQTDNPANLCAKTADYDSYDLGGVTGRSTCGSLQYCSESKECSATANNVLGQDSLTCATCKAQKEALNQILPLMGSIAEQVAEADDAALLDVYQNEGSFSTERPKVDAYIAPDWIVGYCQGQDSSWFYNNKSCLAATDLLQSQAPTVAGAGETVMKKAYWRQYISPGLANLPASSRDFIEASKSLYATSIKQAALQQMSRHLSDKDKGAGATVFGAAGSMMGETRIEMVETYRVAARQQGWIYAGSYFYQMIREESKIIDAGKPHLKFETTSGQSGSTYRNNSTAANSLITQMHEDVNAGKEYDSGVSYGKITIDMPGPMAVVGQVIAGVANGMSQDFKTALAADGNPIINISNFGLKQMRKAASGYKWVLGAVFGIATLASLVGVLVMGTGMTLSPVSEGLKAVSGLITPFWLLYITMWYVNGALLAIYLPLIPFMIFAMGAIGWILATVEAMVAAPIVALGMLSPGGQSEVFGRAEPAVMLLLNLFLRPSLMVIGLMAGVLVSVPVVGFINTTFSSALIHGGEGGLFISAIIFYIYTTIVITVFSKCYTLIYVIPERVLTWIGGQAVQYGEAEALQAVKQATEAGAGAVAGAAKEVPGSVAGVGSALGTYVGQKIKAGQADKGIVAAPQNVENAPAAQKPPEQKS